LQLDCHGTFHEAIFGGCGYLGAASQHHDTENCLLAQRTHGDRPQLVRYLIEPVQYHRDPAGPDRLRAALACEERVT
jgi:hypothetical protein